VTLIAILTNAYQRLLNEQKKKKKPAFLS